MKIRITAGCLIALAATLLSPSFVQAEDHRYSVGLGFEFSSGKYGSNIRTDSVYAPLTIIASPTDRFGLSLEIPYVYQNNGNALSGIARGGMQSGRTMMRPAAGMSGMSGPASDMSSTPSSSAGNRSKSGVGEMTLKGGYILLPEKGSVPQVRATAFVKFPTADEESFLGTGEFDEGFAVEISKWFGAWNPFAEAGYVLQGKSSQLALRNYLAYNAGVGYQVAGNFRPLLLLKGATSPADGVGSLLEARLKLKYQATSHTGIEGYLAKGITTNSPDYGAGLSLYYDF
ncbi:MAG: hypothetical protein A2075_04725 [Geobacteraceae bacterium GWC2_58_44]|nr:MAG: hypothetical protein A2075_04725 [Geobacteraceae bacterium GWC2_58_44]